MANGLGLLCHKKNGVALCFKKSGSKLVYKSQSSEVTVRVAWGPQSYVCNTYSCYHDIRFSCSGSFTSGSGSITSQSSGGTEVVFKLKVASGPAVFTINTSTYTGCGALEEDPGATCRIMASQRDATPRNKAGVAAPRGESGGSPGVTTVTFDANCKLSGIS